MWRAGEEKTEKLSSPNTGFKSYGGRVGVLRCKEINISA